MPSACVVTPRNCSAPPHSRSYPAQAELLLLQIRKAKLPSSTVAEYGWDGMQRWRGHSVHSQPYLPDKPESRRGLDLVVYRYPVSVDLPEGDGGHPMASSCRMIWPDCWARA